MKNARILTRLAAYAIIICIAGLAGLGFNAFRNDLEALKNSSKETILWSAAQLEFELARFVGSLGAFAANEPKADAKAVNSRFDVLWSRVKLFKSGDTGQRLSEYEQKDGAVRALFADMTALEGEIVGLKPGDHDTALRLADQFGRHATALRQLTLAVLHGEENKASGIRAQVRLSAQLTAVLSLAAIGLSILAMVLFNVESRRYRRLATLNLGLAEAANRASLAKSRFLTMMSHELRTPMNGVLGLLALARQSGLPKPQLRLVEQAERSGREMIDMLADILDFSAIQDDRLHLDSKPFPLRNLAAAVEAQFDPVARREGVTVVVQTDPAAPREVRGDLQRLRQALGHLVAYILGTAGVRDVSLTICHDGHNIVAELALAYGSGGAGWRPELVLGAPERDGAQFVSDALGPAVARMLISRMGGSVELGNRSDGRTLVTVRAPAEVVERDAVSVQFQIRTASLRALAEAAVRGPGVEFHPAGMPGRVDYILLEAGAEAEASDVADLRLQYPMARLVGLGRPRRPDLFDMVADLPGDLAALRSSVADRLAS